MTDELRAHDVTKFTGMLEQAKPRQYFTRANTTARVCEGCGVTFVPLKGSRGRFHSTPCCREFRRAKSVESPARRAQRQATRHRAKVKALAGARHTEAAATVAPVHQFIPEVRAPRPGSIALAMLGARIY